MLPLPLLLVAIMMMMMMCVTESVADTVGRRLSRLDPYYEKIRDLRPGAQGAVMLARPRTAPVDVVVKSMPVSDRIAAEHQAAFLKLVTDSAASYLGVPRLLDLVRTEAHLHLVMQYFKGQSLGSLQIRPQSEFRSIPGQEARLMRVLFKILAVVNWAHARRHVHLDLSARNILIDQHDSVAILDWPWIQLKSADRHTFEALPPGFLSTDGMLERDATEAALGGYSDDIHALGRCVHGLLRGVRSLLTDSDLPALLAFIRLATGPRGRRPSAVDFLQHDMFADVRAELRLPHGMDVTSDSALPHIVQLRAGNLDRFEEQRFRLPGAGPLSRACRALAAAVRPLTRRPPQ